MFCANRLLKSKNWLVVPTVMLWMPRDRLRSFVISRTSWSSALATDEFSEPARIRHEVPAHEPAGRSISRRGNTFDGVSRLSRMVVYPTRNSLNTWLPRVEFSCATLELVVL